MHRTKRKNVTQEATLLKQLRDNRGLSMPQVAALIGKSVSWISHVENGRMDVTGEHLNILLPLYGQTTKSFHAYLSGAVFIESAARKECLDTIRELPDNVILSIHPLILQMKTLLKENNL